MEQEALYKKFNLDEAWNSKNNKPLSDEVLRVYTTPGHNEKEPVTCYKLFFGPNTAYEGIRAPRMPATFADGTSNTFGVVEAGPPVPWAKPDDIEVDCSEDSKKELPEIKFPYTNMWHVSFWDGSVRSFTIEEGDTLNPKQLRLLIMPTDGNNLDFDALIQKKNEK
jgi:hypothetical protein